MEKQVSAKHILIYRRQNISVRCQLDKLLGRPPLRVKAYRKAVLYYIADLSYIRGYDELYIASVWLLAPTGLAPLVLVAAD